MAPEGTEPDPEAGLPVALIATDPRPLAPQPGWALCLSGGGYRAMLFHLGALWRLNEAGLLPKLDRISSVSGGSIVAATLGLKWSRLGFDGSVVASRFVPEVVEPVRRLAGKTLDVGAVLGGVLGRGSVAERIAGRYAGHLLGRATLQDLPDRPRFVFNATNVQSGALWRFMKPYMRDYRVGKVENPTTPLAVAVAASAAFPPVLSPLRLDLDPAAFTPRSGTDLQQQPYTSRVFLSDGGVYDNLGLETAWKRFLTILVSDGGGKMEPEAEPKRDWARHSYRVLNLIDDQVRNLRKRQLIASYRSGERTGTYWGIRTHIADYRLADPLDCPPDRAAELADLPTRLRALDPRTQERLVNWGYAVCDAALRRHVDPAPERPAGFPYPGGVG